MNTSNRNSRPSAASGAGGKSSGPHMQANGKPADGGAKPAFVPKPDFGPVIGLPTEKTKVIGGIQFGMMPGHEMMRLAHIPICSRELYRLPSRQPAPFGVLDPRLGISDKSAACGTCGQRISECAGHWGVIPLELPVYHIGFLKATLAALQSICKVCSRVLLAPEERKGLSRLMRDPATDPLKKARLRKKIQDMVKKCVSCPYCGAVNGVVKKVNGATCFRIIHDRYRGIRHPGTPEAQAEFAKLFEPAQITEPGLASHLSRAYDDISPLRAKELLSAIPDCDLDLLWHDRSKGRPESMLLSHILVPPVAIRPSVAMDAGGGSNEDDITIKLQEIVHINGALRMALDKGASARMVQEDWDFLQVQAAALINGEMPGMPPTLKPKRPIRALAQRLKGKQGRFRGNLSGKRVDFSGRTVISPDPNLPIHAVGVPILVAKIMTYPERVTNNNIERLRAAVRKGTNGYPGATTVRLISGMVKSLSYGDPAKTAEQLRPGDVVERHMIDGDPVLFNRQPSLHKMSIMCHRAKVLPGRTFRFNECVCTPYNADFDGDEMNLHLPQTEESRAEAANLMDVRDNMITSRSGEPLIAAHQDFITAAWLLTQKDVLLDREQFCQAAAALGDGCEDVEMPQPAILKPGPFWTGKQVMSLLLKPNSRLAVNATFEARGRNYAKKQDAGVMCPEDGYVVFHDSQLLAGNLDKETVGGGSKKGLVYVLIRDNSGRTAARALHRLTKLTSRWLANWGFSIGIEDVSPSQAVQLAKGKVVQEGYSKCDDMIGQFRQGTLPLQPGCNEEQSLEALMNGSLSRLRDTMGNMCMAQLARQNPPRVMATAGSKGSVLNISQMVACVGQQSVGGQRIQEGFVDRTLPIFPAGAKEPGAKGFVANSFYSGLSATEFFFHTMGGREGLVDTAVKTAETGYMQRRMMKSLEDLSVQYDGSVRSSGGDVVQFSYGDDGLDPAFMEDSGRPVELGRVLAQAQVRVEGEARRRWRNSSLQLEGTAKGSSSASSLFVRRPALAEADPTSVLASSLAVLEEPALSPAAVVDNIDSTLARDAPTGVVGFGPMPTKAQAAGAGASSSSASSAAANGHGGQGGASAFLSYVKSWFAKEVAGKMESRMRELGMAVAAPQPGAGASSGDPVNMAVDEPGQGAAQAEAKGKKIVRGKAAAAAAAAAEAAAAAVALASLPAPSEPALQWVDFDQSLAASRTAALAFASKLAGGHEDAASGAGAGSKAKTARGKAASAPVAADADLPALKLQESAAILTRTARMTTTHIAAALRTALFKYRRAQIQPGEAVGAVAAHSLGEPATQMTLKTFHFAGVASMNVTLGVPRIKEIMNAARVISTPIIEAALENAGSEISARAVKARIEKTSLGGVAMYIAEVYPGSHGVATVVVGADKAGAGKSKAKAKGRRGMHIDDDEDEDENPTFGAGPVDGDPGQGPRAPAQPAGGACEVIGLHRPHLEVRLDLEAIERLQLASLTTQEVRRALLASPRLHLKADHVFIPGEAYPGVVLVTPPERKVESRKRAERAKQRAAAKEEERAAMLADSGELPDEPTGGSGAARAGPKASAPATQFDDEEEEDEEEEEEASVGSESQSDSSDDEDDEEPGDEDGGAKAVKGKAGAKGGRAKRAAQASDAMSDDGMYGYGAGYGQAGGGDVPTWTPFFERDTDEADDTYFALQALKTALRDVIVQGIPSVARAVITKGDKPETAGQHKLLVEGYDLLAVMGTPGVKASATKSNHVIETEDVLGIEAARRLIMSELARTYGSYGITVDPRHTQLLSDVMTYRGTTLGITRFGIAKMKDSVLMLASFEKTPDHLFDAAVHSRADPCRGVSESIIVGTPIPLGTGLFKLMAPAGGVPVTGITPKSVAEALGQTVVDKAGHGVGIVGGGGAHGGGGSSEPGACFKCGKTGHKARDCPTTVAAGGAGGHRDGPRQGHRQGPGHQSVPSRPAGPPMVGSSGGGSSSAGPAAPPTASKRTVSFAADP